LLNTTARPTAAASFETCGQRGDPRVGDVPGVGRAGRVAYSEGINRTQLTIFDDSDGQSGHRRGTALIAVVTVCSIGETGAAVARAWPNALGELEVARCLGGLD
jgi:hypothetical protein